MACASFEEDALLDLILDDVLYDKEAASETESNASEDSSINDLPAIGEEDAELQVLTAKSCHPLRCG